MTQEPQPTTDDDVIEVEVPKDAPPPEVIRPRPQQALITGAALAEKIRAQVDSRPETLYMGTWEDDTHEEMYDWRRDEFVTSCGTTRCVAGWAVHFNQLPGESSCAARARLGAVYGVPLTYMAVGRRLLGIDVAAAEHLFLMADEEEAYDALVQLASRETL